MSEWPKEYITTEQSAYILNVSKPYVLGLLDLGRLQYKKFKDIVMINYQDVLAYKEILIKESEQAMTELAELTNSDYQITGDES